MKVFYVAGPYHSRGRISPQYKHNYDQIKWGVPMEATIEGTSGHYKWRKKPTSSRRHKQEDV